MILASPDVALSLRHWEWAEYISEGFVILGCAGELFADLGKRCVNRRLLQHIERWSTIVLVLALTIGLKCLVKTNELSGYVIGSLGDTAEEADTKAKTAISDSGTALSQAKDALTKAGAAQESLGKAEGEAKNAQTVAANALTLSSGARKEADSFEKDIQSAKTEAAEAESHLVEATKSANILTAKLERLTTPRALPLSEQVLAPLKAFGNAEYVFIGSCPDQECFDLVANIDAVLKLAGWKRIKGPPMRIGIEQYRIGGDKDFTVDQSVSIGTLISVETLNGLQSLQGLTHEKLPEHIRAAIALNQVLALNIIPSENTGKPVGVDSGTTTAVRIDVGRKPF